MGCQISVGSLVTKQKKIKSDRVRKRLKTKDYSNIQFESLTTIFVSFKTRLQMGDFYRASSHSKIILRLKEKPFNISSSQFTPISHDMRRSLLRNNMMVINNGDYEPCSLSATKNMRQSRTLRIKSREINFRGCSPLQKHRVASVKRNYPLTPLPIRHMARASLTPALTSSKDQLSFSCNRSLMVNSPSLFSPSSRLKRLIVREIKPIQNNTMQEELIKELELLVKSTNHVFSLEVKEGVDKTQPLYLEAEDRLIRKTSLYSLYCRGSSSKSEVFSHLLL